MPEALAGKGMDETFFLTKLDLSKNLRLGILAPLGLRPMSSDAWIPASDHPISDLATFVKNIFFQFSIIHLAPDLPKLGDNLKNGFWAGDGLSNIVAKISPLLSSCKNNDIIKHATTVA